MKGMEGGFIEEDAIETGAVEGGESEPAVLSSEAAGKVVEREVFPGESGELLDDVSRRLFVQRHFGNMDPMGG